MDVLGWIMWVENELIDFRRVEMEYTSFTMIDPNDGMIVFAHKMTP